MQSDELIILLKNRHIDFVITEHPPLFTVADGHAWHDRIPGLHCKNLFITEKNHDQPWLICCPADSRPDLNALARDMGCKRFSFADAVLMADILGISPGSVTPFAVLNDTARRCRVLLDAAIMAHALINVHPLRNDQSLSLAPAAMVTLLADYGFSPHIRDIPARTS